MTSVVAFKSSTNSLVAITAVCKAAGDPLRAQILRVLQQNSFGVLELCDVFQIRQSAMSHHLKILFDAGLVTKRREGTTIYYRRTLNNPESDVKSMQTTLFRCLDHATIDHSLLDRLKLVNNQRTNASISFFNANAKRFEANQDLIAGWSDYGEAVEHLLEENHTQTDSVLEVGPGYGQFLKKLSMTFEQVIALDSSSEMLEQCLQSAKTQDLRNIEFIVGDTTLALKRKMQVNCVSLNMVLHHNPSPYQIISDCAALLAPGGVLLVTDLCSHNQEWAKLNCGDLWLGFDPAEISQWTRDAGLTVGASLYLAQRNGFRVQLRHFIKPALTHSNTEPDNPTKNLRK